MSFDEVPVACVNANWLSECLLPAATREFTERESSVCVMPTDSHRESEFLCTRIASHLSNRLRVKELVLDARDPTLGWETLFGLPDSSPAVDVRANCDVLLVRGGNYVPKWFVDEHLPFLQDMARCFRTHFMLPVSRYVGAAYSGRVRELSVPSLANAPPLVLRELILHLIRRRIPDARDEGNVDRSRLREQLCEAIVADQPESRTSIEDSLEFYSETFDPERFSSILEYVQVVTPKNAVRRSCEPASIRSREMLKRQFDAALARLSELSRLCVDQWGEPLFSRTHESAYPFASSDPLHWFIACVSYLSCLFFDAAKKSALSVFLSFSVDGMEGSLLRLDDDSFPRVLRILRTFFQHNLNSEDVDDRRQLAAASEWFANAAGDRRPFTRHVARLSVAAVLDHLSTSIERLSKVMPAIQQADELVKQQIRAEIARNSRTVASHEVARSIQAVIESQQLELDWKLVFDKYGSRIGREVKESTCGVGQVQTLLFSVCERYCYEMKRQPPSVGSMFKAAGFDDRQIGESIAKLNREWKDNPQMTEDEYLELARGMAAG